MKQKLSEWQKSWIENWSQVWVALPGRRREYQLAGPCVHVCSCREVINVNKRVSGVFPASNKAVLANKTGWDNNMLSYAITDWVIWHLMISFHVHVKTAQLITHVDSRSIVIPTTVTAPYGNRLNSTIVIVNWVSTISSKLALIDHSLSG